MISSKTMQETFRFFARHAAVHYKAHRNLPPDAVLVWLAGEAIGRLHQFPTEEVRQLFSSDKGRSQLAYALNQMLHRGGGNAVRPPDVAMQILLTTVHEPLGAAPPEAITLIAQTLDDAFSISIGADPLTGEVAIPLTFDLAAARLKLDMSPL